jgi:calcineurin-like phosphoesterase family protein
MGRGSMAKVLIVGDLHLSSSNRGRHHNYPEYSLGLLKDITRICRENDITHLIDLGDLTYGNFRLGYRRRVEGIFNEQYSLVNGNRYTLYGNHDVDSSGISEHDYYTHDRGLLKLAKELDPALNLRFHFVPEGEADTRELSILDGAINIVLGHDYFVFSNSRMPNYGDIRLIEQMPQWYGTDMAILGHIHEHHDLVGEIFSKDGESKPYKVLYPGSPGITTYKQGSVSDMSRYILIDTGEGNLPEQVSIRILEVQRAPHDEVFKEPKVEMVVRGKDEYDITDILHNMDSKELVGSDIRELVRKAIVADNIKDKALEILDSVSKTMV